MSACSSSPQSLLSAYLLLSSGALSRGDRTLHLAAADLKLVGEAANDWAGDGLSSAGDVDGDGLADLLVGAPEEGVATQDPGRVYVYRGGGRGVRTEKGSGYGMRLEDGSGGGGLHDRAGDVTAGIAIEPGGNAAT